VIVGLQSNRGTEHIASADVQVDCISISTHERLPVGVIRPSESPPFFLARVGPMTPKQVKPNLLRSVDPTEGR
jgi:hypothetical protein